MNILMLNNEYPPLGGGQGNANKHICDHLKNYHDLNVDVITSSVDKYRHEKSSTGTIYYLDIGKKNKNLHFQTSTDLTLYSVKALLFAINLARKNKYDLVVAWSGLPAGFIALLIKLFHQTPYIILIRGADIPFYEDRWKHLDRFIFSWLTPIIWRHSKKTYANSKGLQKIALTRSTTKNIGILTNGVNTDFFTPATGRSKSACLIVSVGRLSTIKGFDYLIKALAEIRKTNIELWIIGDGPEKQHLEILAIKLGLEDRIKFLGIKTQAELSKIYQKANIYCLSSLNEGMSNTVLEAMASGLPLVVTDVGGSHELVNENGYAVEPGNVSALSCKIEELAADKKKQLKMGRKSRKLAEQMSWKTIAQKFYKEFQQCR